VRSYCRDRIPPTGPASDAAAGLWRSINARTRANRQRIFQGDSFSIAGSGFTISDFAFDPDHGATLLVEAPAVPEPSSLWLLLLGLGALGAVRIR
jgi:hypothetical protein